MELSEKIKSVREFATSELFLWIQNESKELSDEYDSRINEAQELASETRTDWLTILCYSQQDKNVWYKKFILSLIDKITEKTDWAQLFINHLNKKIWAIKSHLRYKVDSDFPCFSEIDKLRFTYAFNRSICEKNDNKEISFGDEMDSFITVLENEEKEKNGKEDEIKDRFNPYASSLDDV